jgi:hypothetical protein
MAGGEPAASLLYDDQALPSIESLLVDKPQTDFEIIYASESAGVRPVKLVDVPPPVPEIVSPPASARVQPNNLILDWSDVTDPSGPITYNYKSAWAAGSYGPVSTGTLSQIDASGSLDNTYTWQVQACDAASICSEWSQARG